MEITNATNLASAFRQGGCTWPGGYPLYLLTSDGAVLCRQCFKTEYPLILESLRDTQTESGWHPAALLVLWETEDGPELCAHCSCELESAYGVVGED
jgi:hypothetical protein